MTSLVEQLRAGLEALPDLAKFAVAMILIVVVPKAARRCRVPEAVALLLVGVAFGPYVLGIFPHDHPVAQFFSELGMLLLMFFAGLEIDLTLFREQIRRSIAFGVATTFVPLALGTLVTLGLGYGLLAAVVVGSLLASHTLLGSTIIARLGLRNSEPFIVTVGATMMSDILSLLVFAICVPLYASGFSAWGLAVQVVEIVAFVPLVLLGLGHAAAWVLRRLEREEEAYFVVMLAILAGTALLAQVINLPGIVGSFLAGLAINAAVKDKPAKSKLEFISNTLFVPCFFCVTGFLVDPVALARSLTGDFALAGGLIGALVIGKWIAAEAAGRAFGYGPDARRTIWSLTLPQLAATLAATLVATRTVDAAGVPLADGRILNSVLLMILFTAVLGPVLTQRFAPRMVERGARTATSARAEASADAR